MFKNQRSEVSRLNQGVFYNFVAVHCLKLEIGK